MQLPRERDEERERGARQDNKNLMHNNTGEQMTISKYKYIAVLYCHICNHSAGSAVVGIVENLCLMFLEGTTSVFSKTGSVTLMKKCVYRSKVCNASDCVMYAWG